MMFSLRSVCCAAKSSAFSSDVRTLWDGVQITRLNDKNIKFVLTEPFVPFLDYLTFGILPKHLLESVTPINWSSSGFNLAPVGSGPYKFDHLTIENGKIAGVVLTASKTYFGQVPFIDQIRFPVLSQFTGGSDGLQGR